jgi:transposase InsO family protein
LKRGKSLRRVRDEELKVRIRHHFDISRGRYGSPRIHFELQDEGIRCSVKRVARLMRELKLSAQRPKKYVRTTNSAHGLPVAKNELDRQYQVERIEGLNRAWAGDITYIPTAEGWLYLAVVLDLKSRRVIGWSMADSMEQSLVQDALSMASGQRLAKGKATSDLLFHSDRGSQYASRAFQQQLKNSDISCSMSRKGNCWDNAPLESFFATLKKELVHRERYLTHEQAKSSLFEYIEIFYNRIRRHSALGYMTPAAYELHTLN